MPASQVGFPSDLIVDPPVIETKTVDYTALGVDFNGKKIIEFDSATPIRIIINAGYQNAGALLIVQMGLGPLTVEAGANVTLLSPDNALTARAQYSMISIIPRGNDTFFVSGDLA